MRTAEKLKPCICGELVEAHVRFHWTGDEEGHYVTDERFRAAENRARIEAARAERDAWPKHLQRASELFGDPPYRAPAFLEIPQKRLWRPEAEVRREGNEVLRTLGYSVYDLEQEYRRDGSRQTQGIGDAYFIGPSVQGWIEYKRWDNEPSKHQYGFAREVLSAGGIYLLVYDTQQLAAWHQWGS